MSIFKRKRLRTVQPEAQSEPEGPSPPPIKVPSACKPTYDAVCNLRCFATKFYDSGVAQLLGIDEQLRLLAFGFGWENFLTKNAPTFESLTKEFISTVRLSLTSEDDEPIPRYDISFRMFNKDHTLTLAKINEIFGFNPNNNIFDLSKYTPAGFTGEGFWREITGIPQWDSKGGSASNIHHPAMRTFHRMIGYVLYSKQELNKVSLEELKCLYLAARPPPNGDRVNSGFLFIRRCVAINQRKSGYIQLGGMISMIAAHLGYDKYFPKMSPLESKKSNLLDYEQMTAMRFFNSTARTNIVSWWLGNRHHCYLPDPQLTTLDKPNPWLLERQPMTDEDRGIYQRELPGHLPLREDEIPIRAEHRSSPRPPPHSEEGGSSSLQTSFNLEEAMHNLSLQHTLQTSEVMSALENLQRQQSNNWYMENQMYHYHVTQGHFDPYLNYGGPTYEVQQGPLPGWNDRQPTHPYFPPRSSVDGGFDYRVPGGMNPVGDPALPPPNQWPDGWDGWDGRPTPESVLPDGDSSTTWVLGPDGQYYPVPRPDY